MNKIKIGLLIIALSTIACQQSYAQFKVGVTVGVNIPSFKAEDFENSNYNVHILEDAIVGFHGGLAFNYAISDFYIQPELIYTSMTKDFKVTLLNDANADPIYKRQKIGRLDVPVLFGAKLGLIKVNAGPMASIVLKHQQSLKELNLNQDFRRFNLGYQIGAGLNLMNISLDVRYEGLFNPTNSKISYNDQPFDWKNTTNQIVVSVALLF